MTDFLECAKRKESAIHRISFVTLSIGVFAHLSAMAAEWAAAPELVWRKSTIFSWATDRCEDTDTPDAPPRAFRDYRGLVHLLAPHEDNRQFVGQDFDHLHHSCRVVYMGRHSNSPKDFSDRVWLTSFSTVDGRRIFALGHDEFNGHLRRQLCPSGLYSSCWENAITLEISDDGGDSFSEPTNRPNLIASIPYTFQGDIGRPIGYFQPTNLVQRDGYYYVMFRAEAFGAQEGGTCVARSNEISDPGSWRAWNGRAFETSFENPYLNSTTGPAEHVCTVVGRGSLFDIGSLTFDLKTKRFLALTSVPHGSGNSTTPPGVYLSQSVDLITWSKPSLLISEAAIKANDSNKNNQYGFYSLIDEASPSLDFSTIGDEPKLELYYVEMDQTQIPYKRNLVKTPIILQR